MIVLAATRVDDRGHFKYVVEAETHRSMVTEDLSAVVDALEGAGVQNPYQLVSHAEHWGLVEARPEWPNEGGRMKSESDFKALDFRKRPGI